MTTPELAAPRATESQRSVPLFASLVAVPAVGYVLCVVVPWLRGEQPGQAVGRLLDVLLTALTPLGAMVSLAASAAVLLSAVRGARTAPVLSWVLVALASLAVLAWFLTPAAAALTSAQLDQ